MLKFMEVQTGSGRRVVSACPKPYSRKKLRQLMPRNHQAHTAGQLLRYGHKPGKGRWKAHLEALEEKKRDLQEQKKIEREESPTKVNAVMRWMRELFSRKSRHATKRTAAQRGK